MSAAGTGGGLVEPFMPIAPRIRGLPTMPSNGALPIENPSFAPTTVEMLDGEGNAIEGVMRQLGQTSTGWLEAFRPNEDLEPGTYQVTLIDSSSSLSSMPIDVQVVPAFADGLPPIMSAPSTSVVATPSGSLCCETPLQEELFASCFVTQQEVSVAVGAGLSSSASSAQLNQYVFRLLNIPPLAVDVQSAFMPFELVTGLTFWDSRDEYCLELEAQNIATFEIKAYEDTICAPGTEREVGVLDVEVEDRALARSVCPVPPAEHEERWCMINDRACDTDPSGGCELYDFVCNDGPFPASWSGRSDEDGMLLPMTKSSSDGCTASTPRASRSSLGALLPLLALIATRLRRKAT